MKKYVFFAFSHFNNFFVTYGHVPAIFNFLDMILSELSQPKPPGFSNIYLKFGNQNRNSFYIMAKLRKS